MRASGLLGVGRACIVCLTSSAGPILIPKARLLKKPRNTTNCKPTPSPKSRQRSSITGRLRPCDAPAMLNHQGPSNLRVTPKTKSTNIIWRLQLWNPRLQASRYTSWTSRVEDLQSWWLLGGSMVYTYGGLQHSMETRLPHCLSGDFWCVGHACQSR